MMCKVDQTHLSRTFFSKVLLRCFFVFVLGFFGNVKINNQFGVTNLHTCYESVNKTVLIGFVLLIRLGAEHFEHEKILLPGE